MRFLQQAFAIRVGGIFVNRSEEPPWQEGGGGDVETGKIMVTLPS